MATGLFEMVIKYMKMSGMLFLRVFFMVSLRGRSSLQGSESRPRSLALRFLPYGHLASSRPSS